MVSTETAAQSPKPSLAPNGSKYSRKLVATQVAAPVSFISIPREIAAPYNNTTPQLTPELISSQRTNPEIKKTVAPRIAIVPIPTSSETKIQPIRTKKKKIMDTQSDTFIGPSLSTWSRNLTTALDKSRYSGLKVINNTKVTNGSWIRNIG